MAANDKWLSELRDLSKRMDELVADIKSGKVSASKEARAKMRALSGQLKELEIEWRRSIGWPLNKTLKRFSRKTA